MRFMRRGVVPTKVLVILSVVLLATCGCSTTNASSPHTTPGASVPPTRVAQPAAPLSVYTGSTDGSVSAFDAVSGAVRWHSVVASSGSTITVAALGDDAVYVSATNVMQHPLTTILAALRASDGSVLWHKAPAGTVSIVATGPGVVYLALDRGEVTPHEIQMLRAQDGAVLWHILVEGAGPLYASMHEGTIYVTSFTTQVPSPGYFYASTVVYALDARTGAISWRTTLARTNYLAAVAGGAVYFVDTGTDVVCEPNVLHVLSASDGTERWHSEGTLLRLIGVEQGRAYVAAVPETCAALAYDHTALSARNTSDGSSVWETDVPSAFSGPLANGVIYLPGADTALAAYSARDGSRLWHVQGESGQLWALDQGLYASVAGVGLDALNPANGSVRWRLQTHDAVFVATLVNGILYAVISSKLSDSLWNQAVVALRASTGEVIWRAQLSASADTPTVTVG
jgi:outer membrane protein assembly factor BamB